jgi:hypothetical protein
MSPLHTANDRSPRSGESVEEREEKKVEKRQPWKEIWPNHKQAGTQMQVYGFKKGEVMEILGNAGNFFARGRWEVEHDTLSRIESETAGSKANKTIV